MKPASASTPLEGRRQAFFVYVDYFAESKKPFYVGKGSATRLKVLKRNDRHTELTQGREWYRVAVNSTDDEREALTLERQLIRMLGTRDHQGGANCSDGGEGASQSPDRSPLSDQRRAERTAHTLYADVLARLRRALAVVAEPTQDPRIVALLEEALSGARLVEHAELRRLRMEVAAAQNDNHREES